MPSENSVEPRPDDRDVRVARLRDAELDHGRRRRRWRLVLIGLGVAVVALLALAAVASGPASTGRKTGDASQADPAKANVAGETVYRDLKSDHVTADVSYPADPNPPVGGPHDPVWQNADGVVYDVPLRTEHAVHSLEHGAVWLTYRPGLSAADVARLGAKVTGIPYRMMSPRPGQPAPIIVTAWGHQLRLTSATDARLDEFLRAYTQGPQAPEPGGPVTGGRATP
ncbi:DUF3105 domain-containing protein [Actinoplanes sp. NPDC049596]|uniref:DUF3105 domain-containing protein n=1 Tax=unclassified Actinoplanes TaxID=2626549 RepID=UPI003421D0DB